MGAASPFSGVDPALGLSLGWELTPWLGFEGRGTWFSPPAGVSAYEVTLGARVAFKSVRPVLPFASAGIGFYRARFDTPVIATAPHFYRHRIAENAVPSRTFDDSLLAVGGGTEVFVSRHIALRPELTVMLVSARSDMLVAPVFGMHMAYHFESHPITP